MANGETGNSIMSKLAVGAVGLVCSISLAMAGFSMKWQWEANAQMKVLQVELEHLRTDNAIEKHIQEDVVKLQATSSKHWKLHSWSKDEINRLRVKARMEVVSWPDNIDSR